MAWATHHKTQTRGNGFLSPARQFDDRKDRIRTALHGVEPVADYSTLKKDDIVLCKVNGSEYLHLFKALNGKRFQIGNNRGRINGWVTENQIFGKCVKVEN